MAETYTKTVSKTYTRTRASVLNDHFELFLRCAEMDNEEVNNILKAVDNHELEAVGIYIIENGYRSAEVEFCIDWETHEEAVHTKGDLFDTYLPGWINGQAPEAYIAAGNLVKAAKALNTHISSWIRVSCGIRSDPVKHRKVCEKLGYSYQSSPPAWKNPPKENKRSIQGLEEASVITRDIIT